MTRTNLTYLALAVALQVLVPTRQAAGDDQCYREPSPIESLADTSEHLILKSPRSYYVLQSSCIVIERRTFGNTLNFSVLNRFPKDTQVSKAFLFVKSDRTLTTSPHIKVSLSRGDGWFLNSNKGQRPKPVVKMNFEPYQGTVKDWNNAHSKRGGPLAVDDRIEIPWHAFATDASSLPSTVPIDYWKITEPFDVKHDVRTNYLIRFTVNTDSANSLIPFQVYIQPAVKEVKLTIFSNIDALSQTYRFIIK
jgi:hypothetical protein